TLAETSKHLATGDNSSAGIGATYGVSNRPLVPPSVAGRSEGGGLHPPRASALTILDARRGRRHGLAPHGPHQQKAALAGITRGDHTNARLSRKFASAKCWAEHVRCV